MDSELQIGLVALGVVAVVGIIAYNKWQERKQRKHAERTFRSDHRDVLLDPQEPSENGVRERSEPQFGAGRGDGEEAPISAAPLGKGSGRHATPGVPEQVDTRVDCVIQIESIEPLDVQRLWTAQREALAELQRSVRWFGFDDSANVWRLLTAHSAGCFHWFCAAMQMVNRQGAITDQDFGLFSNGVQRVADQFLAVPANLPARVASLTAAAEIDRFCAGVDVQVGINIVSQNQPFAGTKVRALAEASGMIIGEDGAFHAQDEEGRVLFSLANLEPGLFAASEMRNLHTNGITLVIDVPLVAEGVTVFDRMMRQANQMAHSLDGKVVDDNRASFGPESVALIRSQIQHFQAQMDEAGVPAGSSLALRLFAA
ncbi:MAG TPA: cell division protein ZipA C-terminal FtsZ-binding domain-containing protein [Rhodocyclaceae bacterium]|nr:cell division protein ZipA C-terminal FtsZ-binding domain-containing protein [Rhodocyclaceae bacterium]